GARPRPHGARRRRRPRRPAQRPDGAAGPPAPRASCPAGARRRWHGAGGRGGAGVIPDRPLKALVTGAARDGGIGQAIVARLEADGMEVVTLDVEPGCTWQVDVVCGEHPPLAAIDVLV